MKRRIWRLGMVMMTLGTVTGVLAVLTGRAPHPVVLYQAVAFGNVIGTTIILTLLAVRRIIEPGGEAEPVVTESARLRARNQALAEALRQCAQSGCAGRKTRNVTGTACEHELGYEAWELTQ